MDVKSHPHGRKHYHVISCKSVISEYFENGILPERREEVTLGKNCSVAWNMHALLHFKAVLIAVIVYLIECFSILKVKDYNLQKITSKRKGVFTLATFHSWSFWPPLFLHIILLKYRAQAEQNV